MADVTPNFGWTVPDEDSSTEVWQHVVALGVDADATVKSLADRATALEGNTQANIGSIGPGFSVATQPRIYRSGAYRRVDGVLSWDIGGQPSGSRRVVTIDAEDRPALTRFCGGSWFYRVSHQAVPVGLFVDPVASGEIRIADPRHIAGTLASGAGWFLALSIGWYV